MRKPVLSCILLVLLSGCAIGPDFKRPVVDAPMSFRFEEAEVTDMANSAWWEEFGDPVLNELVITALHENKDIRIATARIEDFLGRYTSTRANLFPQVNAGATAARQRVTQEAGPIPLGSGVGATFDTYEVFLSGSWEIDFWGRLRRATEAARADLLSTEEARRTVILTLVSAVATAYMDLLTFDKQLDITLKTADTRKKNLDIYQLRFDHGVISQVVLSQSDSEYRDALSRIPDIERAIAQTENALSVLLGRNPGDILRGRRLDELTLPPVPSGLPSELLERRPDIRQAEQNLIAANARIGVAKASYFPVISLTTLLGSSSTELSNLFTGPAKVWSLAAPITMPIFTAGRIRGEVKSATAAQQQALFAYEQAIQNGFREVDDALVDRIKSTERLVAQGQQIDALRTYSRLSVMRYDEGYASYVEVLDAERSLFNAELSYAAVQGNLCRSLIDIYRAMGGGWVSMAEDVVEHPSEAQPAEETVKKAPSAS